MALWAQEWGFGAVCTGATSGFCLQRSWNKGKAGPGSPELAEVTQGNGKMRSFTLFSIPGAFLDSGINFMRFWGHKPGFCVHRSKTHVDVNKIYKQNINTQTTVLCFVSAVYV